jgi:RNA polymerase sigma-70 factor, ECF subfamily
VGHRVAAQPEDERPPAPRDWARTFEAQLDYVHWTLRNFGARPVEIDDLSQEVFLVMWRRRASYDPARPLRPWIAGIAFRALQEARRRGRREHPFALVDAADEAPAQDDRLEAAQARGLVRAALARVPEKQRAVLVMHEIEGLPMRDIARLLDEPLFTLYSRLHRGRRAFAREVRRDDLRSGRAALAAGFAARPIAIAAADPWQSAPAPAQTATATATARPWLGAGLAVALLAAGVACLGLWLARAPAPAPAPGAAPAPALDVAAPVAPAAPAGTPTGARASSALAALRALPSGPATAVARTTPRPPALARGLVAYWRFDEPAGSLAARDLSGQGNDCLLRKLDPRAAWGPGALAGALALTGRGWLECPAGGALTAIDSELTIAAWVTRGAALSNYRSLVARQLDYGRQDEFMFGFANGRLLFASHAWRGRVMEALPEHLPRWFHVAVTRREDGTTVLYAGGQEIARGHTARGSLPAGGNPIIIGAAVNGPDPGKTEARFEGGVDELVIYDRALAGDEIAALAARTQPPDRR